MQVDTVVLCGVQTPNCIRATAFDAVSLDYHVAVLSDATASQTPEVQRANLLGVSARRAFLAHALAAARCSWPEPYPLLLVSCTEQRCSARSPFARALTLPPRARRSVQHWRSVRVGGSLVAARRHGGVEKR